VCSDNHDGSFHFPSIDIESAMDIALNNNSYVPSGANQTYIYPILPEIGCNEPVTSIEYCFTGRAMEPYFFGASWPVFALSVLHRRNNTAYSVEKVIEVWTSVINSGICERPWNTINYCCDTRVLAPEEYFRIPSTDMLYGITVLSSRAKLLSLSSSFQEYSINVHRLQRSSCLLEGELLTLNRSNEVEDTLKLVKFRIGK